MKIQVNKQNVGLRIKQIRLDKGYIFKDFGKLFGASDSSVIGWENGRSLPNKERIKAIAKLGDITVNELLYGSIEEFIKENFEENFQEIISNIRHNEKYGIFKPIDSQTFIEYIKKFGLDPKTINNIPQLMVELKELIEEYYLELYEKFEDLYYANTTTEEKILISGRKLFSTVSNIPEDNTPQYSLQVNALIKLYSIMAEHIKDNLNLFNDKEVERLIKEIDKLIELKKNE